MAGDVAHDPAPRQGRRLEIETVYMETAVVNWLAVVAAAVATFVLGGVWYSPVLFYRPWLRLNGVSEEAVRGNSGLVFGASFVLELLAAAVLAMFVAGGSFAFVVGASFAVGAAWVAASFGVTYLFERRPLGLFAINAGYHIVAFTLMGVILAAWR